MFDIWSISFILFSYYMIRLNTNSSDCVVWLMIKYWFKFSSSNKSPAVRDETGQDLKSFDTSSYVNTQRMDLGRIALLSAEIAVWNLVWTGLTEMNEVVLNTIPRCFIFLKCMDPNYHIYIYISIYIHIRLMCIKWYQWCPEKCVWEEICFWFLPKEDGFLQIIFKTYAFRWSPKQRFLLKL